MEKHELGSEERQALEIVLGYLNFSSGASDAKFLTHLNGLWSRFCGQEASTPTWRQVGAWLRQQLHSVSQAISAFHDVGQAEALLELVFEIVVPGYLKFHCDLLFHRCEEELVGPFFVGRVCEAVLRAGPPWQDRDRILQAALSRLNDFLGYRPVAVLESRKTEPYAHERLRPVPLYVRGAGVAAGRYQPVVQKALSILQQTDGNLLQSACFDPVLLDELAFDPRPYDFDHPANKRPNHHFGMWDPHVLDGQGRYRRFVIQQATLDALMRRFEEAGDLPGDEVLFEASAVLAGTILMAAGISGAGPDTFDSTTTLASLLPRIAAYRDAFYERLIGSCSPAHAERLKKEAVERRQPFGAARQHLNAELAKRRASQLEHTQLAKIFARMGYPEAAAEEADLVSVASARFTCQIECRLTIAHQAIRDHLPEKAASLLEEAVELVHRGIECGAIVDPWNILGFDAQFSLFPALENSIHDHRIDELVDLMEGIFGAYSRAWSEAAALDKVSLSDRLSRAFREVAEWWRRFAAHEVSQIEAIDSLEAYRAAEHVARALNLWHKGGASTGNIGFWAPHAEMFDSPRSYALVIEALLERRDFVASMGLLIHWLGAAESIALEQGEASFHQLVERWFLEMRRGTAPPPEGNECTRMEGATWVRMSKFLDYIEANAGESWHVPTWELGEIVSPHSTQHEQDSDRPALHDDEPSGLFGAAYENVVYHDSTNDGVDGELFETSDPTSDELMYHARLVGERLAFHNVLSRLWRITALAALQVDGADACQAEDRAKSMARWVAQAEQNLADLLELADAVQQFCIPSPRGDHSSMLEYDQRRYLKESLLERIITSCVETATAARFVLAVSARSPVAAAATEGTRGGTEDSTSPGDEQSVTRELFAAILQRDVLSVRRSLQRWIAALAEKPLLYVPLAKGGHPHAIVEIRLRQRCMQDLLSCLPRLGLIEETCRLLETARDMERTHPIGPGAVTEFDELFRIGWSALVESLVASAKTWDSESWGERDSGDRNSPLVACLERLTEAVLASWLEHSRTLRLSVLEKVADRQVWNSMVEFVQRYGEDLFTQRFLSLGNLRAILHQGVDSWLSRLQQSRPDDVQFLLLDELGVEISRPKAIERLTLILEAIVENYGEYRDYNSTTTQSDRGEMLHTLLDFLRLRAKYDRICWNLKPVVLAHEILVRSGFKQAAQLWRRALRARIKDEADKFQTKLANLQKKYAMQMPSIADRIGERFIRPLVIDRVRALVQPAIAESVRRGPHPTFRLLRYETEFLTREPSGGGFDVPAWLVALDEEVQRIRLSRCRNEEFDELRTAVARTVLSFQDVQRQVEGWTSR